MEELETHPTAEITRHIKEEVLTAIPAKIEDLDSVSAEILRDKLHILRYYCIQKDMDSGIVDRLNAALDTNQDFWELLEENANTLSDLKETYKMRWFDLGSGLLTEFEEIISGEESFRDIIINSIAILLGWKADTLWVDMAEEDLRLVPKVHIIKLKDHLWTFISELSQNGDEITLDKATEISKKMDHLLQFTMSNDIPVAAQVMLISQIYILLLRLNIGKIIINLESNPR
jgi:hypothetical protein